MSSTAMSGRKLSNEDVIEIFQCIHNNRVPPKRLRFQIIVVGSNGMKLSPPSYKFEDGLYILLKPLKKTKKNHHEDGQLTSPEDDPRIPSNLKSYVFKENPAETCPWSLSGPQYQRPCKIQQRYCYPKGDPEYSKMKGGSLWTETDGKVEDVNFRLLHVYYSAKRAGNKGNSKSTIPKKVQSAKMPALLKSLPPLTLTAPQTPKCDSFGSSFDDSPLSFRISPVRDPSVVSLLTRIGSIDTDAEPLISPDRGFFDVATEYERANCMKRSSESNAYPIRKKTKSERGSMKDNCIPMQRNDNQHGSHERHYSGHYYHPYWSPYHSGNLYPTHSNDSHERRPGAWGGYHPNPASPYPMQHERKPTATRRVNKSSEFINELKAAHHKLQDALIKTDPSHQDECARLFASWGRQIADNPRANFSIEEKSAVAKRYEVNRCEV